MSQASAAVESQPTATATGDQPPKVWAEYLRKRAVENYSLILRVTTALAVLATLFFTLYAAKRSEPRALIIPSMLWTGVVTLRFSAFGKQHPEGFATVLATMFLLIKAYFSKVEYDWVRVSYEKCNSLNLTTTIGVVGKSFSDARGGITTIITGDYCADYFEHKAHYSIVGMYATWLTFTMVMVLLLRLRFRHSLLVAGVPGLVEIILASEFALTAEVTKAGSLLGGMLISYIPGMLVCLGTPYITGKLHYSNYLLHRAKDEDLRRKSSTIRVQSNELKNTKKKLAEAQKVVDKVMAQGGTVLDQYSIPYSDLTLGDSLGEGSFGTVFKATFLPRGTSAAITVAVKTMRVDKVTKSIMDKFREEISVMAPLYHPNLVRLYGAVWNEGPDKLCIVLEFVANGSLLNVVTTESDGTWETQNFVLAHGIARCMKYLHHERPTPIMHRDLKPANVLVDALMQSKVADFGEARHWEGEEVDGGDGTKTGREAVTMTMVGTELYVAPEVVDGQVYNKMVDVYSFSYILLELALSHTFYIKEMSRNKRREDLQWRPPVPPTLRGEHPKLVELIETCWKHDYKDRPSFNEIESALAAIGPPGGANDATYAYT